MNQSTILPVPIATPGFGGFGYGAPAVAPAVAPAYGGLTGDFYAYEAAIAASENACRGVEATKASECSIKDSIMMSNSQRQTAELNLHNRLCDAEKAAIEAKWAGVTASKDVETHLLARIEECCCDMKLMNLENKQFITEKFAAVNEKFCDIEKTRLADEIAELRQEKTDGVNNGILSTLNAILTKIK